MQIHIGTSGYTYSSWKGGFYPSNIPQKKWLEYYAQHFDTVEVNATFYRSFPISVYKRWSERTPSHFTFSIKGPRTITHYKKLSGIDQDLNFFLESCSGLGTKLTALLWQFPASFTKGEENLARLLDFFELIPKTIFNVFELRDESWFDERSLLLFNKPYVGLVINETPAFDTTREVVGASVYIRFHGPGALYASSYSEQQLSVWAQKVIQLPKTSSILLF